MRRYIKGEREKAGVRGLLRRGSFAAIRWVMVLMLAVAAAAAAAAAGNSPSAASAEAAAAPPDKVLSVVQSRPDIAVEVNGRKLALSPPPLLADNRLLIPLRAVGEAMGGRFTWNAEMRTVEIEQAGSAIRLWPDVAYISVDNRMRPIDTPPILRDDRLFVPLRLLCETFGDDVIWDGPAQTARITLKGTVADAGMAYSQSQDLAVFGLRLGDGLERARFLLGEPRRIDPGEYGFNWWVYNSDPARLVMVGIGEGRVRALFTAAQAVTVGGVAMDAPRTAIEARYPLKATVKAQIPEGEVEFRLSDQDLKERPLWTDGEKAVIFYLDSAREGRLAGILLIESDLLKAETQYSYQAKVKPGMTPLRAKTPGGEELQKLTRGYERQVLDLTNAIRLSRKSGTLLWDEDMVEMARSHCRDMADNRFFSHDSPTKGSYDQRVTRSGVPYRIAGENLARGHVDAIQAAYSWLNSPEHRENLLSNEFRALGAGVEFGRDESGRTARYYAQEFVTRK
ncbi:hypothetical protein GTO89_04120 [Heliobacterium gestii]|uniref:Uncharacterized protein n=1 Tax=Heliomicrobium gestii TaxID=2699 RepID=A0A845LCL2_HELGE|nr:CAP-associated domain-containing protein [Heliomicrobium gestii]MBM7866796.1 uncharacterized protein YkwD [Heliomicrobium gestii]MZP42225.1 hypothetical protein [Heliomicrobium gestii]